MAKTKKQKTSRWQAYKPLLVAAVAVAGVFNLANVVSALGTDAGTDIDNTATATYGDGNGGTYGTTSNTVTIRVAEIAGLNVVASPVVDVDGPAVEAGDDLVYDFTVTNSGNAPTDVFVPGQNNIVTDNFTFAAADAVQVFEADGTTLIGTVDPDGETLTDINGAPISIPADGSFIVRVTGTPAVGTTAGQLISVTLGNTADNTTVEGADQTQNQTDIDDGAPNLNDLRTVNSTVPADGTATPVNLDREAQADASIAFAGGTPPLALASVLKEAVLPINVGSPSDPTDDLITYSLGLDVAATSADPNFTAAPLEGTTIQLDTGGGVAPETRILVSDVIPDQTDLSSVSTTLPAGWTAVYSVDTGNDSLAITWTTTPPVDLTTVTRVGFIFNGNLPTGASVVGLEFTVVTSGLPATGGGIENIAQVFGETLGDTTNSVVYDESGDASPNNYVDPTTPRPTPYTPGTDTGIAPDAPAPADVDTGNNNTGSGPDGEINVVTISPTTDDILNGTQDVPNAVGPTGDDNDDFTNKSSPTPAVPYSPTDAFDPAPVVFDNSLSNPGTAQIRQVTIEPLAPSEATTASGGTAYGADTDIPDNTTVTISFGGNTAVYTYTAAGGFTTTDTPINVGDVNPGVEVDYTVTVDLPAGTAEPVTAVSGTGVLLDEVSVPIVAFPDDDPSLSPGYTGETTNNITVDRLYTGFMELIKRAQVLDATGTLRGPAFSENPTEEAAPGEFIEYQLEYRNISTAGGGTGNVTLTATDFLILEDGTVNGNNWAAETNHQQNTSAAAGSDVRYFTLSGDGTPAATNADPANGTPIEKYENQVPTVNPGATGTFEFRRQVN